MRPGAAPVVQNFRLFHQSTLSCLEDQPSGTFSGISKYGTVCWIAKGAHLEVLDMATMNRRAAWQFGRVTDDPNTTITGVEEVVIKNDSSLKLLVGISNSSPNGVLCLFDVNTTMIEKTIEVPYPVTAIDIVSTAMGDSVPRWAMSEHLTYFCGIVAVGCSSGHTFLVDLRLDDKEVTSSEEQASKVQFISPRNRDVENQRLQCLMKGQHLCIPINESLFTENGFEYQKPDGVVMKTFRLEQVTVTCLTYIPQTGILAIGYNFGCYQLWKLQVPVLEYSSRLETDPMPVTHIVHQEPENDPKNFCYLWIARSQLDPEEEYSNTVASIAMYQFSFGRKAHYNSYGVFYDDLASICLRLDHELTPQPIQYGTNYEGTSRVLACYTLGSPYYQPPSRLTEDSFDESNHGPDLSLCVFVWEATEGTKTGHHMAIFDINRWYHAQMPAHIRYVNNSVETCSYMCFYKLNETQGLDAENLLTAYIDPDRLQKFHSNSLLPPEQHFYPSSLGFDATLIYDSGSAKVTYLGDQGQVLSNLKRKGPLVLVQPQEMYNLCLYVGLLARPIEIVSTNMNTSYQRESLLSLALDYDILSLFKACVTDWASGEYLQQGCSLKYLLDWAWQKVSSIKHQIDTTCVNLYNWSGLILDQRSSKTLHQCEQKLIHLGSIFRMFTNQAIPITEQGEFEIQSKIFVSSLLSQHLSVVLWFVHVGLLPENDDTEVMTGFRYAFPVTNLVSAYKTRRNELQKLNSDTDLLMIDGLVASCEGIVDLWDREGGDRLYPPPSLHALLSTYLLEDVDMATKHSLTLYLLLDLVSMETPEDNVTLSDKIVGFTQRYNLSQTLVKQVQAYWLLDHKDFEEAMSLLETSNMTADFTHWQHRCILKALFYQEEIRMALRYLYIANPPLYTLEDIKLKITVLLANGFVSEALAYHRKTCTKSNTKDLLTHVFYGCQQTKTVDRLLGQLRVEEERMLEEYLESNDPTSMDLLVMHYLQSSRIVEAFQLNEKLKQYTVTESSSKARERAAARNAIVDKYISIYPDIQRQLLFEQIHVPKRNTQWRRVVQRPTPLSTNITKSKAQIMTHSSYIMKIMDTIQDIEPEETSPDRTMNKSVGPFLCTPVVPSRKSFIQSPTSVLLDTDRTDVFGTPKSTDKRRSYFSASCLTLLQTPKVKKVTPEKQRRSATNTVTPQSILKVRNLVNFTSPSPHSGGSTPSSQETGSGKKRPRKLGYSSQSGTPRSAGLADQSLTGIPRHLRMEVLGSSQPTTPKSVSFVEPSSPLDSPPLRTPKQGTSQPGTPKSVSFTEKTFFSAAQLKPLATPKGDLSTPKRLGIVTPKSDDLSTPKSADITTPKRMERKKMQRSPPAPAKSVSPPKSPRSVKERSPTPESSERSPKFAEQLDQLCRRSIHDHSPSDVKHDENVAEKMEQSDENISDEDMETEESSPKSKVEEPSLDTSVTSGESVIFVTRQSSKSSPTGMSTKQSPKPSPKLSPTGVSTRSSPKVSDEQLSPKSVDEKEQSPKKQSEMEIDEEGIVVSSSREIFSREEEITVEPSNDVEEILDAVTSSNGYDKEVESVAVKQEVGDDLYEPPPLFRQLTPPSSMQERSPTKREIKDSPPSSAYDESASPSDIKVQTPVFEKITDDPETLFGDSPDVQEEIPAPIPGRGGLKGRKSNVKGAFKLENIVLEDPLLEPLKEESEMGEIYDEDKAPVTPTRSSRLKKESETVQNEAETVMTPTRSSRRLSMRVAAVQTTPSRVEEAEAPLTPTRSSRRLSMRVAAGQATPSTFEEAEAPLTPTRSSRRLSMRVAAGQATPSRFEEAEAPLTPTRSSRRLSIRNAVTAGPSTPTRSQKKTSKAEKTEVITAVSPKPFSSNAKQAVQESLISLSNELKTVNEASPSEMTKIREKSEKGQSPSRTPTRSSRRSTTPNINTEDQVEKATPTRSRGTRKGSVANENVDQEQPTTPTRGTKKAETKSPARQKKSAARDKNTNNVEANESPTRGPVELIESETVQTIPVTPTRRSKRSIEKSQHSQMDIGQSDIPVDIMDNVEEPSTPSRRSSLGRSCKLPVDETAPDTPSRRRSLGRSTKKPATDKSPKKEEQKIDTGLTEKLNETEAPKTPTRRGRGKVTDTTEKTDKSSSDTEHVATRKSPSRRGKTNLMKDNVEHVNTEANDEDVKTEVQKTPRRGGRPKKSEADIKTPPPQDVKISDESENEGKKTPSRRGRSKKQTASDGEEKGEKGDADKPEVKTPSRRGRSKEEKDAGSETESKAKVTPSRRKRAKKDTDVTAETTSVPQVPELYDIQSTSFQFSNPMEVDNTQASEAPKSFTPVKSFIFSPPIQHARSRLEAPPGESKIDAEEPAVPEADDAVKVKEVKEKVETVRATRKNTRLKKLYTNEEVMMKEEIVLLSEDSDVGDDGLAVMTGTRVTRGRGKKKDDTKKVLQNLTLGMKTRKTSHRVGPIVRKK